MKGAVPNSLINNLVIVLTNCDETTCNFELKLLKDLNTKNVFYMQNNCFSNDLTNSGEKLWRKLELEFTDSMETMDELFKHCRGLTERSAEDFARMKMEREKLQLVANQIITDQTNLIAALSAIEMHKNILNDATARGDSNKDFTKTEKVKVMEMKKTEYYSTACQEHLREFVCHENCGLRVSVCMDEGHFRNCSVAEGSNCRKCKCSMAKHYHIYEIPYEVEKDQETIIQDMKLRFEQANNDKSKAAVDIKSNEDLKKALEDKIDENKKELERACQELKSICTRFNFYEELKGVIENLAKEAVMCRDFEQKKHFETLAKAIKNMIK